MIKKISIDKAFLASAVACLPDVEFGDDFYMEDGSVREAILQEIKKDGRCRGRAEFDGRNIEWKIVYIDPHLEVHDTKPKSEHDIVRRSLVVEYAR